MCSSENKSRLESSGNVINFPKRQNHPPLRDSLFVPLPPAMRARYMAMHRHLFEPEATNAVEHWLTHPGEPHDE